MRKYLLLFASLGLGCDLVAGLDHFSAADGGAPHGGDGGTGQGASGASGGAGGVGAAGAGTVGGAGGHGGQAGGDGCADDLLIVEARTYGTGAGDDDFVEIYNPTDLPISLENVSVAARTPTQSMPVVRWTGQAGDELAPGDRFTIVGAGFDDNADWDVQLPSNLSFGNDIIFLLRRGPIDTPNTIDILCVCDDCTDPGFMGCQGILVPNPAFLPGNSTPSPIDVSVHRKPECRDTDTTSDFVAGDSTPGGPPP
ncbi:MAG: lamin tail domain-containing protein [Polyangiaceae bacterium]